MKTRKNRSNSLSLRKLFPEKSESEVRGATPPMLITLQGLIEMQTEIDAMHLKGNRKLAKDDPEGTMYAGIINLFELCIPATTQLKNLDAFLKHLDWLSKRLLRRCSDMSHPSYAYFMIARLLDLPLDRRQTTVAQLVASLGPKLRLAPDLIGPITTVAQSRMAIYEHCGFDHGAIVLRELVTNREKRLLRPSGYSGKEGELWFVRLAPCPAPESASPSPDYCISLTPPHILTAQKQEWLAYFARNDIRSSEEGSEHRLGAFLKFGQGIQFWSDFLYENHCGRVEDVAFVSGVPDIRSVDQVTSEPRQEPAVRIENRSKTYLATEPAVPMVH